MGVVRRSSVMANRGRVSTRVGVASPHWGHGGGLRVCMATLRVVRGVQWSLAKPCGIWGLYPQSMLAASRQRWRIRLGRRQDFNVDPQLVADAAQALAQLVDRSRGRHVELRFHLK